MPSYSSFRISLAIICLEEDVSILRDRSRSVTAQPHVVYANVEFTSHHVSTLTTHPWLTFQCAIGGEGNVIAEKCKINKKRARYSQVPADTDIW
jgi:hypothetical protein